MTTRNKKYPKAIAGAFIFNDKGELFLMRTKQWNNKYNIPGGRIEIGEGVVDALKREVKEETGLELSNIKLFEASDGLDISKNNTCGYTHLIFLHHTAEANNPKKIKLDKAEASSYKWLKIEDWLKRDVSDFAGETIYKAIEKIKFLPKEDYADKYKRALADYQNLLKRTADEKQEFAKYANENLVREFIPVYDNLRTSLEHIDEAAKSNGWAQGIKYVIKQFKDALEAQGVKEIKAKGKKFDLYTMEAMEGKGDKVSKVVKAGYTLNGKVIIPARVVLK